MTEMISRLKVFVFVSAVIIFLQDWSEAIPTSSPKISPIEIIGNKFFDEYTGEQFFMKGIAYQPSRSQENLKNFAEISETKYIDPLANPEICLRDIPYLRKLNVNTIRVYSVDPQKSHDICMEALADAGIYLLLDLAEPDTSIARDNPTWDVGIWKRYKQVVDSMQKYPNLLGFFAGNEVTNDHTNTDASPFVKAAIRDVKNYIKIRNYREIPVGYSTNDDADTRGALAEYFTCGDFSADFYGINMYEWCGYSSYGTSGYKERTEEFKDYPIPVFFSEFGCNIVRPRPFTEVAAIYGPQMSKVWSGGLVYMYFEEENEYGVVSINKNGEVVELQDFENLRDQFSRVQPVGTTRDDCLNTSKTNHLIGCPKASENSKWQASEKVPHTPDEEKCKCLEKFLPCLVLPFKNSFEYQEHIDFACSKVNCTDIIADGEAGIYGEFSDCTPEQKLALQMSKIYLLEGGSSQQCPIQGKNIYFNSNFKDTNSLPDHCTTVTRKILQSKQGSDAVLGLESGTKRTKTSFSDQNSGSELSSHSTNSGYAILFMAVFIASFLL